MGALILSITKSLLHAICQRINVQRDNGSKEFTHFHLSPSFQFWKRPKNFHSISTVDNQLLNSTLLSFFVFWAISYLSTTVWFVFVMTAVPEVALDRSVNLESNAFIGSILDGVVNTEEDDAGGAVETEVAFTLPIKGMWEEGLKEI